MVCHFGATNPDSATSEMIYQAKEGSQQGRRQDLRDLVRLCPVGVVLILCCDGFSSLPRRERPQLMAVALSYTLD